MQSLDPDRSIRAELRNSFCWNDWLALFGHYSLRCRQRACELIAIGDSADRQRRAAKVRNARQVMYDAPRWEVISPEEQERFDKSCGTVAEVARPPARPMWAERAERVIANVDVVYELPED